ncbi:MAG: transcription-repair coupling factor [Desulfobacteraceae bacterium 4572_130]|nr:MAG: transcription-repair coupling factor [Desulfobacteraceae bacterium 4572_130]
MIKNLCKIVKTRDKNINITGVYGSEKAYVAAKLFSEINCSLVIAVASSKHALKFKQELDFFLSEKNSSVIYFPGYNILPFKSLSYNSETASRRISALYKIACTTKKYIIITYIDTLLQKIIPKQKLVDSVEVIVNGDEIDRDLLISKLDSQGYNRVSIVEETGDYSVRGGILDIFSPENKNPVRIEMFGDLIESLRYFSPVTQRGISEIEQTVVIPANEVVIEKKNLPSILTRLRLAGSDSELNSEKIQEYIEKIKEHGRFEGMESMLSIVYPKLDSFFDYALKALLIIDEPGELQLKAQEFKKSVLENYKNAKSKNKLCVDPDSIYLDWKNIKEFIDKTNPVLFRHLNVHKKKKHCKYIELNSAFKSNATLLAALKNKVREQNFLKPFADFVFKKQEADMAVVIVCNSDVQGQRLISLLRPYGIEPEYIETFKEITKTRAKARIFYTMGNLVSGFSLPEEFFVIVTYQDIFGIRKQSTRRRKRAKTKFITPEELKKNDIVVHYEHGLGKYKGLFTITVNRISGDFILILYKDNDKLYLPVDRMEMLEKYIGIDGYSPLLDKIGGKVWIKSKAKAKKEAEKIAGELLNLYAERKVKNGFAFSCSDSFFNDFEMSFPYEETPDQLKAIDDVLFDMEDKTPMDRLVCGDVGYGKTEVAIRAAFKSFNDGKQTAIVVPTTILAEQHLKTFKERFKSYSTKIEAISRFKTKKEQTAILKNLVLGKIDIIIGTHRLLQKDINFKSLGLLVIDEEQRFGVKDKEALRKKRSMIDVLSLTATPIPRSLHMSLIGIRDISIISTPPKDRQAIISYVSEYDDLIAAEAIRKELARGGQIFFVHNNIKTIFKIAENLQKLVPEIRLGVAHGRLSPANLEKIMFQFINKDIDLLVCTTIVEAGLDIPSVNTMIINRVDRLGLSQIYQLRGRIGRGDEQAYAYLFVPEEVKLTRNAKKRLAALMEHKDLGSGFQIAMKDLQIRGAGSALGVSQSGHIATVGYDMFLKLLDEAVSDFKGKPCVKSLEPEINVAMSSYISDDYIQSIEQRLTIYRRLSQMIELSQVTAMQKELIDRFGKLPGEAGNMLLKIMFRILSVKAGIKKLDLSDNSLSLVFSPVHQKRFFCFDKSFPVPLKNYEFTAENIIKFFFKEKTKNISQSLVNTKKILKHIACYVNP